MTTNCFKFHFSNCFRKNINLHVLVYYTRYRWNKTFYKIYAFCRSKIDTIEK